MHYFEKRDWKIISSFPKLEDWFYQIKQVKKTRSLDINSYYWLCIQVIVDEYKNYWYIHTSWELHKLFKKWLLPRYRVYGENKKSYVYQRQTTTNLNNKEFSKYLNNIILICEHWQLHKIPWLEEIAGFIIPESTN